MGSIETKYAEGTAEWLSFTKSSADVHSPKYAGSNVNTIDPKQVEAAYDKLEPATREFVVDGFEWKGGYFDTGHPGGEPLSKMGWVGKTFHDVDHVDPIMIMKEGKRTFSPEYGHARLRMVEFRGVVSAAMVYDDFPIIDTLRKVNDKMLAGAMDSSIMKEHGTFYFYLYKE